MGKVKQTQGRNSRGMDHRSAALLSVGSRAYLRRLRVDGGVDSCPHCSIHVYSCGPRVEFQWMGGTLRIALFAGLMGGDSKSSIAGFASGCLDTTCDTPVAPRGKGGDWTKTGTFIRFMDFLPSTLHWLAGFEVREVER
eukprot:jgi/Botrbrau1/8215/Bobra.0392s0011.1